MNSGDTTQTQAPESGVSGFCRDCDDYGVGTFDGRCTGLSDWIVDHIGCPRPTETASQ
ncbi:hypothetical protein ACFXDE_02235 [Kitasatospora sp. NPDC059408]|uniref:hypothetical protein n=1 Tax=Kitasatospora sp. NPDC059408 TaxID=3346823 RepID=UPI00368E306F